MYSLVILVMILTTSWAQCRVRDTYTNLPPLPQSPTANYQGAVDAASTYVKDHWSEGSTMMRPSNTIVTSQTQCPHLQSGLTDWHNVAWTTAPAHGVDLQIPANTHVLISSCSVPSSWIFRKVTIPAGSSLVFGDAPILFQARSIVVQGSLKIGSPTCRLQNKINITIYGSRGAQTLPADETTKGIYVTGSIDVHGAEYFPTWTRLAKTALVGARTLFIQDCPNWQPGQLIVVTTTENKDSRDWHRNEEATIVSVETTSISSTTCVVNIRDPLRYNHYGGFEYQAEVALLSRNILIQGDAAGEPTDTTPIACTYGTSPSTYPCEDKYLTGFGVHVLVASPAVGGRFSGIEVFRAGQTNQMGRYALHFHLIGELRQPDQFYVSDSSIHRSYFRCITIHGTWGNNLANGVKLTKNTAYDITGHCYFTSEDGVEENNTVSYNQAAFVHALGPYWQTSYGISQGANVEANGGSFGSQQSDWVTSNENLALADDLTAGCFYFTNSMVDIYGNAASGGWAGYVFPNLAKPVGFFKTEPFSPKNRPLIRFQGNTAHSTGFWQGHAAGIYLGGNLHNDAQGRTRYTAGRSLPARATCRIKELDAQVGGNWCQEKDHVTLRFVDNKIFLANVGLQSWGDRCELIRFEVHDVQVSTNVFGRVWIDQMLVGCRSGNTPDKMSGCTSTNFWTCNARDRAYSSGFTGFQFYDTGQSHMVTNSKFKNCVNVPAKCKSDGCDIKIFEYLTHSDQFTPAIMQMTRGISYENVDRTRLMVPSTSSSRITVSGRLASWLDEDGSVTGDFPGVRTNIGSNWTGPWWQYNARCLNKQQNWICPLEPGDSKASLFVHWDPNENQVGSVYCGNGNPLPCPIGAHITHFGRVEGATSLPVATMSRVTGPVIQKSGGWFIRYVGGAPRNLFFDGIQVEKEDMLHVAVPYQRGTTFTVYATAPSWCSPGTNSWSPVCRHNFVAVTSVDALRACFGDCYFYDSTAQILHIILKDQSGLGYPYYGSYGTGAPLPRWDTNKFPERYYNANGGRFRLPAHGDGQWKIRIDATNCGGSGAKCADVPAATVPPAMPFRVVTPPPTDPLTPPPTAPLTPPPTAPLTPPPTFRPLPSFASLGYPNSVNITLVNGKRVSVGWRQPTATTIDLIMRAETTGYISLGFTPQDRFVMIGSDAIVGTVHDTTGVVTVTDRVLFGKPPLPERDNNITVTTVGGSQENGVTTIWFTRNFNSGLNPIGRFLYLIAATGASDVFEYHGTARSTALTTVPITRPTPSFTYVGCGFSPKRRPALPLTLVDANMSLQMCASHCGIRGTPFFGVTASRFCGCGAANPILTGEDRPISECNKGCAGNMTQVCGAVGRMAIYAL